MNEALDDSVLLELSKLLDQHLLRDGRDGAFEVGETEGLPAEQVKEDHQIPAALEDLGGVLDAAGGRRRRVMVMLTQRYLST